MKKKKKRDESRDWMLMVKADFNCIKPTKSLKIFSANVDFRLKEIVNFAFTAIEGFSSDNIPWCVGESVFYCRVQYMLDQIDFRYPGLR